MTPRPFTVHEGVAAALLRDNIDTDVIIPSRDMNRVSKAGLGESLFAPWRYEDRNGRRGAERDDFVLNAGPCRRASILLTGANFGCGSSREHAVWALADFGIRAVFAPSFGGIFRSNCARNGIVAGTMPARHVRTLADYVAVDPGGRRLLVDLTALRVRAAEALEFEFSMEPGDRARLLSGQDDIDRTLAMREDIARFTARDRLARPWAHLREP